MKNSTFALLSLLVGLLSACSASQDASATGASPTPTVVVPPAQTTEPPVAEKPKDEPPADTQKPPTDEAKPPARLAFLQCAEDSRKAKNCATIAQPVCAEVDTGLRCVRAPCPGSTAQQTFDNACTACLNTKVRGYWAMSCEAMSKPSAP